MSATDTIWTALIILMTVCVCVDSGFTLFSGIQAFELIEFFLFLLFPGWPLLSAVLVVNLMLGMAALFCTKRYRIARSVLAIDVVLMAIMVYKRLYAGPVVQTEHYVNQAFILVLLFESVRSFFTQRSQINAKRNNANARRQPTRTPPSTSSTHYPAFVRGLI